MSRARPELDLFSAVAAGAEGIALVLRKDAVSAVLFWGDQSHTEVVHRRDVPDDLMQALSTSDGRYIADVIRASGQPMWLGIDSLPRYATGLRAAMSRHGLDSLAVFPLFGENGVVGCLLVPLGTGERPNLPGDQRWRVACRVLDGLRLVAATRALEVALEQDRRRHAELHDGVLVVDRSERIIFTDGLFRELPGWKLEDPFGRPLNSLPGAAVLSSVPTSSPGPLDWVEHVLPPIEGHGVPVALTALPLGAEDDTDEAGRVYFLRDLRADNDSRDDGNARLLALGMRIAHDTDTLSHALDVAGRSVDAPCTDTWVVDRFQEEIGRARELVRQVLDACLSDEDQGLIQVNDLMHEVVRRSRVQLEHERVRVFTFFRPDLSRISGDRLKLFRTLVNLVRSARESLRPGGGSLTLRTWAEDGWVYAAVSNDGGGSQSTHVDAIQPLFETLQESQGDPSDLSDVRDIVEGMGGRLLVESRPGVWTRVTLMLPEERRRSARPKDSGMPSPVRVQLADSGLSVLVVDDNAALRSVLRRYLERRGHDVTEAVDAEQGLRIVEDRTFDRIIVDIRMPGKDGPEFYEALVRVAPAMRQRTIFMTGGFLESGTEDFIEESGRPSIKKPFDLEAMAQTVEE